MGKRKGKNKGRKGTGGGGGATDAQPRSDETREPSRPRSQGPASSYGSVRDALRVRSDFVLADVDPRKVTVGPTDREQAGAELFALEGEAAQLHEMLWAQAKAGAPKALLIVLQGMDTSGKGGATKAVDRLVDPLGFSVVGFGVPTDEEKQHGFLWRHEQELPTPGRIKVFDRSHYEAVLVERVRGFASEDEWSPRYEQINAWEGGLVARGVAVLKCMLHISNAEQKQRLLARLADPTKQWKYNTADVEDRAYWGEYQTAFQDALVRCSTDDAPWFVVPSDRKWHRDWLMGQLLVETLRGMGLSYPPSTVDVAAERARVEAS